MNHFAMVAVLPKNDGRSAVDLSNSHRLANFDRQDDETQTVNQE
jgi:hypothetical protein